MLYCPLLKVLLHRSRCIDESRRPGAEDGLQSDTQYKLARSKSFVDK
eukprot:COSAG02_NODE_51951_length_311_cov_0.509434_1_plen_46_part_01